MPDSQREKYGSTSYQDWRIYYYGRKFGIDAFLQQYKGFSLESPGNYGYNTGDPETKRSDLQVSTLGLNVYYVFSDNYSLASSFNQSERQKNIISGSFLLMLSTTLYNVHGDHSLIPVSKQIQYGNDASFSSGNYGSIGIAPGAALTLAFKNFYLTPVLFIGTGFMNKKDATSSGVVNKTESYTKLNLRASAGYNGDGFFCGIAVLDDVTNSEKWFGKGTGMAVQVDVINVEIFFGKRFDFDPF